MDIEEFQKIELSSEAFLRLSIPLRALLIERQGDWDKAHFLVQNESSFTAAWVHAYLHRKEEDQGNANYWYRIAEKPFCNSTLDEEWTAITQELLTKS